MEKQALKDRLAYLSYSKMALWEKSPQQFWLVYFEGIDRYRTKNLELGKRMAKCLETGEDEEHDAEIERVAKLIPNYPNKEFEIRETLENSVPLLGFLDGFDEDNLIIHETKTGVKWNQRMVDKSDQLTFYALLVWLKYRVMPKGYFLHWAKTKQTSKDTVWLTGEVTTFKTTRRLQDIILMANRIKRAWKGIQGMIRFSKEV